MDELGDDPVRAMSNLLGHLQRRVHAGNRDKGFYDNYDPLDPRHPVSLLALIVTEVSEAIEAVRRAGTNTPGPCDKPIDLNSEEEELADIFIRLLDYAEVRGVDLGSATMIKLAYNETRELRHGGKAC